MPKHEPWPVIEGGRLKQMLDDMGDRDKFVEMFQQTPMPAPKPRKLVVVGDEYAALDYLSNLDNPPHEATMVQAHCFRVLFGKDPTAHRIVLVRGWRDVISFRERRELQELGFEIEVETP